MEVGQVSQSDIFLEYIMYGYFLNEYISESYSTLPSILSNSIWFELFLKVWYSFKIWSDVAFLYSISLHSQLPHSLKQEPYSVIKDRILYVNQNEGAPCPSKNQATAHSHIASSLSYA